jgi:hypothetical protein
VTTAAAYQRTASEDQIHQAVLLMLAWVLPPTAVVHHSPNEGKRGRKAQGDLKKRGVVAGWPDLEIIHNGRVLFLELKRPGKEPSTNQYATHRRLKAAGAVVYVADDVEVVRQLVAGWIEEGD